MLPLSVVLAPLCQCNLRASLQCTRPRSTLHNAWCAVACTCLILPLKGFRLIERSNLCALVLEATTIFHLGLVTHLSYAYPTRDTKWLPWQFLMPTS